MQQCKSGLAVCLGESQQQTKDQADPAESHGGSSSAVEDCSQASALALYHVLPAVVQPNTDAASPGRPKELQAKGWCS